MFLLLYYIFINKAGITDVYIPKLFNSSLPPKNVESQNLGISIFKAEEKLSQLKVSEKLLHDSIELFEEDKNTNKDKIISENNYKYNIRSNRNRKILETKNNEKHEEILDKNIVLVHDSNNPSIDRKNELNIDLIKEKRQNKDFYRSSDQNKNKEKNISEITDINTREKRSNLNMEITAVETITTFPLIEITTLNEENFNEETTTISVLETINLLKNFLERRNSRNSESLSFLQKDYNFTNFENYLKNPFIVLKEDVVDLKLYFILQNFNSLAEKINEQVEMENRFNGFDNYCINIEKILEKKIDLEDDVICESIHRIYDYFIRFFHKDIDFTERMSFLLRKFNNHLDEYEKHNIFYNYLDIIDLIVQNLRDIKEKIARKFLEVYDKKNKIKDIICNSYKNQYGIVNEDLNIQTICLERYVCNKELNFDNPLEVKDGYGKLEYARKNVFSCLKKEENKQNISSITVNINKKYFYKSNIGSVIKQCVSKIAKKKAHKKSGLKFYKEILGSTILYDYEEFNLTELLLHKLAVNKMIDELITRLIIYSRNLKTTTISPIKES